MAIDKEEVYIIISNNIRAERSRCRMTQDEVSRELGIDRTTYISWENRPKIDSVDLFHLSCIFGCPIESFFVGLKATESGEISIDK